MNYWELIFIYGTVSSLHMAHIPGNLTIYKSPNKPCSVSSLSFCKADVPGQLSSSLCPPMAVGGETSSMLPLCLTLYSPCIGTICPVPLPTTMLYGPWGQGPSPISLMLGPSTLLGMQQAFNKGLLDKINEWTNKRYIHTPLADNPENLLSRQSRPLLLKKI